MKKINIVKENRDFNRIIKNNRPFKYKDFIIYIEKKEQSVYRFGFSVGKKVGNAVTRNRIKRQLKESQGFKFIHGHGSVTGRLIGGSLEVMEMLKGSKVWPSVDTFDGAIFFIETSEEAPSADYVIRWMRNYAATGILKRIAGIIIGRPANVQINEIDKYADAVLQVVKTENNLDIPVVSNLDFGHTDPMFLIPYGAKANIDMENKTFSISDNAVI